MVSCGTVLYSSAGPQTHTTRLDQSIPPLTCLAAVVFHVVDSAQGHWVKVIKMDGKLLLRV